MSQLRDRPSCVWLVVVATGLFLSCSSTVVREHGAWAGRTLRRWVDLHNHLPLQLLSSADDATRRAFVQGEQAQGCVLLVGSVVPSPSSTEGRMPGTFSVLPLIAEAGRLPFLADGCAPSPSPQWLRLILHLEGADGLKSADDIDEAARLGLRFLGLVHHRTNQYAGSSSGHGAGLSPEGKRLVQRAQQRGVVVDLAHLSRESFRDVVSITTSPLLVSHAGAAAIEPGERNLDDEQIRSIARSGGVIGVGMDRALLGGNADLDQFVRHLVHVWKIGGPTVPAIGSDRWGGATVMDPQMRVLDPDELARRLLAAGLPEPDVQLLLEGNALRLIRGSCEAPTAGAYIPSSLQEFFIQSGIALSAHALR